MPFYFILSLLVVLGSCQKPGPVKNKKPITIDLTETTDKHECWDLQIFTDRDPHVKGLHTIAIKGNTDMAFLLIFQDQDNNGEVNVVNLGAGGFEVFKADGPWADYSIQTLEELQNFNLVSADDQKTSIELIFKYRSDDLAETRWVFTHDRALKDQHVNFKQGKIPYIEDLNDVDHLIIKQNGHVIFNNQKK